MHHTLPAATSQRSAFALAKRKQPLQLLDVAAAPSHHSSSQPLATLLAAHAGDFVGNRHRCRLLPEPLLQ